MDLPNPGIKSTSPLSPALQVDSLPGEPSGKGNPWCVCVCVHKHTYIYMYVYTYTCVCVHVCVKSNKTREGTISQFQLLNVLIYVCM